MNLLQLLFFIFASAFCLSVYIVMIFTLGDFFTDYSFKRKTLSQEIKEAEEEKFNSKKNKSSDFESFRDLLDGLH